VHFQEDFTDGDKWTDRWVVSTHKGADAGELKLSHGKFYGDAKDDIGLQTTQDAKFYQFSAKTKEFSNEGKKLIIQYSVKHEQNIDCGGGYVKLLPSGLNQKDFNGDSDYNIMFGPDICGSTRKVHVIFTYKGKNHLIKDNIPCESDEKTHLYTLIVNPDNTFEVKIDGESKKKGNLKDDFDILAPRKIKDPSDKKPSEWDDRRQIADPEDKKPEGWDDIPKQIRDPDAEKPDDWDDELDGSWEAPQIDNPDYKGDWKAKQIDNPAYKGEWVQKEIDNPDFADDDSLYSFKSHAFIGIEIWQVKSGTIFDRFLVTDDETTAEAGIAAFKTNAAKEKESHDKIKEEERKAAEEEAKKKEAEKPAEDDSDANADADDSSKDEL